MANHQVSGWFRPGLDRAYIEAIRLLYTAVNTCTSIGSANNKSEKTQKFSLLPISLIKIEQKTT
jgi:hypothetical protein